MTETRTHGLPVPIQVDLPALGVTILMDVPLARAGCSEIVGVTNTKKGPVDMFDQTLWLIGTPKGI
jgi:hypothetical protein